MFTYFHNYCFRGTHIPGNSVIPNNLQNGLERLKKLRALQVDIYKLKAIYDIANSVPEDKNHLPNLIVAYKHVLSIQESFESGHSDIIAALAVRDDSDLVAEEIIRKQFMSMLNKIEVCYYKFVQVPKQQASGSYTHTKKVRQKCLNLI